MEQINRKMRLFEAKRYIQYNDIRSKKYAINLIKNYELTEFIPELKEWIQSNIKDFFSLSIEALITLEGRKSIAFLINRLLEESYSEIQKREMIIRISDFMIEGKPYFNSLKEIFHKIEKNLQISIIEAMKRLDPKEAKKFLSNLIQTTEIYHKPEFILALIDLERKEGIGTNIFLNLAKDKKLDENSVRNFLSLCVRYDMQNIIIEIQKTYPNEVEESDYFFSSLIGKSRTKDDILINSNLLEEIYLKKSYQELIAGGENEFVEFKSSLKWDLNGKINKDIEFKCMKVIISFLNTNGGILFIGVSDDNKIIGLESDLKNLPKNKQNNDSYELKITELIKKYSHVTVRKLVKIEFFEINTKTICVILIPGKAQKPIFVKKNLKKYLPVRLGNQSSLIEDIEKAIDYIDENWKKEPQHYLPFMIPPKT